MSIITTAQAVPSRLFAIYAALYDSEKGEVKAHIEAWATPPSLSDRRTDDDGEQNTTLFSNSLAEARRVGLVEEMDDKLRLTADARNSGRSDDDIEQRFLDYMRQVLFDADRAAETQQSSFMLALCWFLSSNPLRPMNFKDAPQNSIKSQIGDHAGRTQLTSINRYQNFLYWARYLGFATIVGGSNNPDDVTSRKVVPDPVKAIERALPHVFSETKELPIEQFLARLSAIYPVFETGSVREEFDAMRVTVATDRDKRLSVTTSLALQRLSDRQKITLSSVADASPRILDFGSREGRVSHIAVRGTN